MKVDAPRRRGVPRRGSACRMDDPCAPRASACGGDPTGVVDRHRQLPRSGLPEPGGRHLLRPDAEHGAPAAARADQQRLVLVPACTTRAPGITQFTFPHDTLAIAHRHRHLRRHRDVRREAVGRSATAASTSRRSCLTRFSRHLPVRRRPIASTPRGRPLGHATISRTYSVGARLPRAEHRLRRRRQRRLPVQLRHRLRTERRRPVGPLEHAGRAADPLRGHQADPVAGRPLRRRRHDDDLGPRPRRDLGSGGPAHRHAGADARELSARRPSARDRRRRGSRRSRPGRPRHAQTRGDKVPGVVLSPQTAESAPLVEARIAEVTVFSDRARVRRRGRATGKAGIELVRFPSLPGRGLPGHRPRVGDRRPRAARRGDAGRARADCRSRRRPSCWTRWTPSTIAWSRSTTAARPTTGRSGSCARSARPRRCPRTSARAGRTWSSTSPSWWKALDFLGERDARRQRPPAEAGRRPAGADQGARSACSRTCRR